MPTIIQVAVNHCMVDAIRYLHQMEENEKEIDGAMLMSSIIPVEK